MQPFDIAAVLLATCAAAGSVNDRSLKLVPRAEHWGCRPPEGLMWVDVDGIRRKAWLFLMRLMYSGRDCAWIYERQDHISFLDGHVRAFAHFDGVPARIAYDNRRAAVVRLLVGGARTLTPRFEALASHYLLEACFCRPGEGHDKGGVESRGKAIRQQALVPIPVGPTLAAINGIVRAQMEARAKIPIFVRTPRP